MGVATNIDEYVPMTTPIIIAKENPLRISPPKKYIENNNLYDLNHSSKIK